MPAIPRCPGHVMHSGRPPGLCCLCDRRYSTARESIAPAARSGAGGVWECENKVIGEAA